jgi:hypothetical protein
MKSTHFFLSSLSQQKNIQNQKSQIVIYKDQNGRVKIDVWFEGGGGLVEVKGKTKRRKSLGFSRIKKIQGTPL